MSKRYCKDCRYCHHANIGLLCMGQKGMPHTSPYGSCDSWKSAKQTNADRIRAMTDEEMALFIHNAEAQAIDTEIASTVDGWLKWLKEEG